MPGTKRPAGEKPKHFPRAGEKWLKFKTLDYAGSRLRFTSRPALVESRMDVQEHLATQTPFTFDPRVTPNLASQEYWVAPQGDLEEKYCDSSEQKLEDDYILDDELEEVVLSTSAGQTGKGQNEMLATWMRIYATSYLRQVYRQYQPPDHGEMCVCGGGSPPSFKCRDCLSSPFLCKDCVTVSHKYMPTHCIWQWNGSFLKYISLHEMGLQIPLGNHRTTCPIGQSRTLTLGDVTGFHQVTIVFCRCLASSTHAPSDYQQLLDARMFPCSDERPTSVFTFSALHMFHIAATEAKLSGGRFYALLVRETPSSLRRSGINRYREFMRVAQEWMWLQTKKRSGSLDALTREQLLVRCPACPRLGYNFEASDVSDDNQYLYTTHISYDGSFQLVRRQRAEDNHDTCLTERSLFFVDSDSYKKYLTFTKDDAFKNTKLSDCNNHKAAIGAWSLYEGLEVTGIGACSCARHSFYMPNGVRFAYTDYAVGSVMTTLKNEGCDNIGFYYDIYCHWQQNWWKRAETLPEPVLPPTYFIGGIPKFHWAGHTDSCYTWYSLNNMHGAGRLDAEGCERLWADANQALSSTANKGSGSRADSLNYLFQDWNWRRVTATSSLLLRKEKEAVTMSKEKRAQWEVFDGCIRLQLRQEWEKLSTLPRIEKGKWTSVYVAATTPVLSVTQMLRQFCAIEQADSDATAQDEQAHEHNSFTSGDWLVKGFEIEQEQEKLRRTVREHGSTMTVGQSLDVGRRRQALQQRLSQHSQDASVFYSTEQLALYITPVDSIGKPQEAGKPETAKMALPS
ncbi:hypothetical protein RhiJN_28984 [Ceratobasidium sp. AG-Ba]|nr:hypothetical protein RhiJN_28984 [Ceratobasidium sp. AG-Ba]